MKLLIGDAKYDLFEGIQKATLSDLILLKRATKSTDFPNGITVNTIQAFFTSLKADEDDERGLLEMLVDSDEGLEIVRAIIFLCRRRAGETQSFDELTDVALSETGFEDDEVEVESGPKDEAVAPVKKTKTSKT
ncbi:hypothetical protein [Cryobacterium fucosi]|uniref:Uncharacterized protein n=1 Tax=Cryobacterium fucosi TaxID=1259157 RepID=A0A4V3IUY9_9MICO|nr:hypothetical protein [Cryobacterium fucosi]TFD74736.1 hypothetical protein E3T48_12485 [Cryobacterium fucosi]